MVLDRKDITYKAGLFNMYFCEGLHGTTKRMWSGRLNGLVCSGMVWSLVCLEQSTSFHFRLLSFVFLGKFSYARRFFLQLSDLLVACLGYIG